MKLRLLLLLLIILGITLLSIFFLNDLNGNKTRTEADLIKENSKKSLVRNSEIISDINMEASPFVWKGKLKYFVAERNDKKKLYELAIYDFATRKREVSFGKGLGLASAAVINNTLYVSATKDWFNFGKSEIYLITSHDLKTFSEPLLIHKADEKQKIFNTTITQNTETGNLVLAYESHDDKTTPFTIYFLESEDGKEWTENENVFGKDIYVACPTIKYFDGYYYMNYSMIDYFDPNCLDCRSYITKIARSKDLKKWQTSMKNFMVTEQKDEGINTSDVDFTEYQGKTYLFYAIGDQSTWGGMKYALYDGNIKQLMADHFIPD